MGAPLVGTSYEVWTLEVRRITPARTRIWQIAVRLRQNARADATHYLQDLQETPPATRNSTLREAINFLHAHGSLP